MWPVCVLAQTDLSYVLERNSTPSHTLPQEFKSDARHLEYQAAYSLLGTTALIDALGQDSLPLFDQVHDCSQNLIMSQCCGMTTDGDYLHTEGRKQGLTEWMAAGTMHRPNLGSLYGRASYQRERLTGVSYNYAVHPEDYAPYLVSDTMGTATLHQENYVLSGAYSRRWRQCHFGLDADYMGSSQARREDPRRAVYTHTMRIGLSVAHVARRCAVALKVAPEWHHQTLSVSSIQDGVKVFEYYGFGQWNRRESQGVINYKREQRIQGISAQGTLLYQGRWQHLVLAGLLRRNMDVEECTNYKNLFGTETTQALLRWLMQRQLTHNSFYIQATVSDQKRSGHENIYQQQLQSEEQGLYDYVHVATNSLYTMRDSRAQLQGQWLWHRVATRSTGILSGIQWNRQEERYDSPELWSRGQNLSYWVGAEMKQRSRSCQWEAALTATWQQSLSRSCNVEAKAGSAPYSMVIVPHRLEHENNRTLSGSWLWAYRFSPLYQVGLHLSMSYLHSQYRDRGEGACGIFLLF